MKWLAKAGGVLERVHEPTGLRLNLSEREEIAHHLGRGLSSRAIGVEIGRPGSTIMREVNRNGGRQAYRPSRAQARAEEEARRPKECKLATNQALRERVEHDLEAKLSPEQIAGRLRREFPHDPEMRVHHETIYRDLFVQARGSLRADLAAGLRKGRVRRVRRSKQGRPDGQASNAIKDMLMIADRPEEVDERVVPGHWEGDLIIGKDHASAIGTLVERTTNYTLLLHLPDGYGAAAVTAAITEAVAGLPQKLRRSLTWDQGRELAHHKQIVEATGMRVYFCDPHSPWQRATNENHNGLLRQYFPKGTDLSVHSREDLTWVQDQFNDRPRKRLDYAKPSELINDLLLR